MGLRVLLFSLLGLAQTGSGQSGLRHLQSSGQSPGQGSGQSSSQGSQQQVEEGQEEGSDWGDISAVQTGPGEKSSGVALLTIDDGAKSKVDPFDAPGCCFAISLEGPDDTPCCLTRERWSWKECFTTSYNPYHDQGSAYAITSGVAQTASTVSRLWLEKGWNQTCPETAAMANEIIKADKARSSPFNLPFVSKNGTIEVPANSSSPLMDLLRKEVNAEIHRGLPMWGWGLVLVVLCAAISAELLQVWREKHSRKKSHSMRKAEVEVAMKIFSTGRVPEDTDEARPRAKTQFAAQQMAARSQEARAGARAQTSPTAAAPAGLTAAPAGQFFASYQGAPADPRVVQVPQAQPQQYYYQAQQPQSPTSPQYYLVSGSSVRPT